MSEVTGWSWVELEEEGGVGGVAAGIWWACTMNSTIVEVTHQLVKGQC